jgi:hypothetical protein
MPYPRVIPHSDGAGLFVYPVVLGRGRRLFEDATDVPPLRLVETRRFRSGVALLRYRVS